MALSFGHEALRGFILHHFLNLVNISNHKGDSALYLAARAGHLGVVRILIEFSWNRASCIFVTGELKPGGPRIEVNEEGNTPLHEVMINGWFKVAVCLLKEDSLLQAFCLNKEGKSPFYLCGSWQCRARQH